MFLTPFLIITLLTNFGKSQEIFEIISKLDRVANFGLDYYNEINFDGLLGFVIAQAQIIEATDLAPNYFLRWKLQTLSEKFDEIRYKIGEILPKDSSKMEIFAKFLLNPLNWINDNTFVDDTLQDLGMYWNWTRSDLIKDKRARYKGVNSDHCLLEILQNDCYVSNFCEEMMLSSRIDKGYLLSHRLFYLQVSRIKLCRLLDHQNFRSFTTYFCSLMYKEAKTNDFLGFPAHDIFLEQMVLCGIEGYQEFLGEEWRRIVIEWLTPFGCFESGEKTMSKRTSNSIAFGCSDHTTGLGAAALALHLKLLVYNLATFHINN